MTPDHDLHYWAEQMRDGSAAFAADDYMREGIPLEHGREWCAAHIPPEIARDFVALAMDPQEAWTWGLVPSLVDVYRSYGFSAPAAREWAHMRIGPDEAEGWRDGGFKPLDAVLIHVAAKDPETAMLWALTGLSPAAAYELANEGASALPYVNARRTPWVRGVTGGISP